VVRTKENARYISLTHPPRIAELESSRRLHIIRLPSEKTREPPVSVHHCHFVSVFIFFPIQSSPLYLLIAWYWRDAFESLTLSVPLIHRMSRSLASVLHGPDLGECSAGEAEHADADRIPGEGVSVSLGRVRVDSRTVEEPRRGHPTMLLVDRYNDAIAIGTYHGRGFVEVECVVRAVLFVTTPVAGEYVIRALLSEPSSARTRSHSTKLGRRLRLGT